MNQLISAALGVFASVLYGGFAYAIAKMKNNETFNGAKFAKFLVIGCLVGAASQSLGVDMATLEGMSVTTLLSIIIDKFAGAILAEKK